MAWPTGDDLVTYLGLVATNEDVGRLDQIMAGTTEWLCTTTGRDWSRTTRSDVMIGSDHKTLVLRHYPVASVTAISIKTGASTITIDPTDPLQVDLIDAQNGILSRTNGDVWTRERYRSITITYVGGPIDVPKSLSMAALELGAYLYQTSGGRNSVTTPDASVSFQALKGDGFRGMPAVKDALELASDVLY